MTAPAKSETDRPTARPDTRSAPRPDAGNAVQLNAGGAVQLKVKRAPGPKAGTAVRPETRGAVRPQTNGAVRTNPGTITAAGTLTVYVPRSSWRYLTGSHRADPAALAARVHDCIRDTLIPEADKIMTYMCPDAGTQFTVDPFRSGRDADRHGFAVHGCLTIHAPRAWGEMLIDTDHPWPPSDDEIATDLDGFAKEVLNEKFGDHLALLCPGAGVWFRSDLGDAPW